MVRTKQPTQLYNRSVFGLASVVLQPANGILASHLPTRALCGRDLQNVSPSWRIVLEKDGANENVHFSRSRCADDQRSSDRPSQRNAKLPARSSGLQARRRQYRLVDDDQARRQLHSGTSLVDHANLQRVRRGAAEGANSHWSVPDFAISPTRTSRVATVLRWWWWERIATTRGGRSFTSRSAPQTRGSSPI